MRKLLIIGSVVALAVSAWATATLDPDTNILTFNVESGEETYSSALGSSIAGIVKTGAGTIILDTASTSFTSGKPITVSGGILKITHKDALGSGNTVTVGGNATFNMDVESNNNKGGQNNDIVLQQNSTLQVGGAEVDDYFLGNVTLTGDATINVRTRRGFGKTLDLGGHTLTRIGNNVEFVLAGNGAVGKTAVVKGPGTIRNSTQGTITVMGAPSFQGVGTIESAHGSTVMNLWNLAVPMPWNFKATQNATFRLGRGLVNGQSANPAANIWAGDVEIATNKTIYLTISNTDYKNDYLSIAGDISGEGGVSVSAKAEYRLSGTNNTYSGGTTLNSNYLRVYADGNVSTNGPVKIYGGVLEMHLENAKITSDYVSGLAAAMAPSQYSDGNGTLRFITGGAQDVTLTSDLSPMHQSIGIAHAGDGALTLTGNVHDDAMIVTRGGHLTVDGDWSRRLWSFGCYNGTMDVAGGSLWREYNGAGSNNRLTFKVGDSNDVTSARMRVLAGGKLYFPCSGGDASEAVKVGDLGTKPAILEIHSGAVVTGKVQVALDERTRGAVYQYGGDVFHMTRPGNDGAIGGFGQAYWWMENGTFKAEHANPYLGLASRTGSESQFEVQGGTVSINGANSLLICRGGASNAEFYMGGGTATINQIRMGGELTYAADKGADPGGQAVLTLSGTNNPSLTVSTLRLNDRTNQFTSVVNLNAGKLTASSSVLDVTRTSATRNNCKSFVNFNGGSLSLGSSENGILSSQNYYPTRVTVFGKGATIDYGLSAGNWYTPFQKPEGRGIKSITVPDEATTEGYAMPPVVYITGGGGEGATAHVRFNPRTGRIDREIEVTSPGCYFISAPTVTIKAPDMKTDVTCNVELTEGEQESGGLTKTGTGYLSVYAANTYTGETVVAGGTFYMQHAEAVPLLSNIRLAGGHLATRTFNPLRARFGGYGTFASWDSNRLTITNELYYSAADLEQGRNIKCTGGHFYLGDNCVVSIDDFGSLTQDRYTLMWTSGTGIIHGPAKFANAVAAANPCWRLSQTGGKITLRRLKGLIFSVR